MRLLFHLTNKKKIMIHDQLWPFAKKIKETKIPKKNIKIEDYGWPKNPLSEETTKKDISSH